MRKLCLLNFYIMIDVFRNLSYLYFFKKIFLYIFNVNTVTHVLKIQISKIRISILLYMQLAEQTLHHRHTIKLSAFSCLFVISSHCINKI
jgi:hypothetical protein